MVWVSFNVCWLIVVEFDGLLGVIIDLYNDVVVV